MKLLVAGGAGFIGSAFVRRRLAATEDSIVVLDRLTYAGSRANLAPVEEEGHLARRFEFVLGDICDASLVARLAADVDAIVNFAAETHVDRSIVAATDFLRTGVIGLHVLLEAARQSAADGRPVRLVQVSTDEVYGSVEAGAVRSEDDPLAPRSPYAAAKAAGDLLCLAYRETYGSDVVVTRGANTYGPYQHPEKLIPLFITNALLGEDLPLYGDGRQVRDWLYVDDHADAVSLVLDRAAPGTVWNVPGGQQRENREIVGRLLELLDKPWSIVRSVEDRPGHDLRYAMDGSRLAALGWQPQVTLDDGLAATVAWYRQQRDWWERMRGGDWADWYDRQYGQRLAQSTPA